MTRKIGLLGGTFNPIHKGHLQLAAVVRKDCGLDNVTIIPAASPPHKDSGDICDIGHRYRMVHSAVQDMPFIEVSDLEIDAGSPSYTVDTLAELLHRSNDETPRLYFISGHDAFVEIETWHRWEDVLGMTNFIVVLRRGFPSEDVEQLLARLDYLPQAADKRFWRHRKSGKSVRLLAPSIEAISSSQIRRRIGAGRPWHHLVPESVASYITKHGLYRGGEGESDANQK